MSTTLLPVSPSSYYEWFDLSSRPLLELALRDARPAYGVRVEWLVDYIKDGALKHRALSNFTQILRVPFVMQKKEDGSVETFAEAARSAGEKLLDDMERVLWYGKPSIVLNPHTVTTCGGVKHYLRRRLYENDWVSLRQLRPPMLRDFRGTDVGCDGEWLVEFSLQVVPGHHERGMKPICLPPSPGTPKAWAQGASLEEN